MRSPTPPTERAAEVEEKVKQACRAYRVTWGLPRTPTPVQLVFLTHRARRSTQPILLGGGKGGGKSAGTCLNAIKWCHLVPDNRVLLCRGTYADLVSSTVEELSKQLRDLDHWRFLPGKHQAHNLRNGAQIWWTGVASETSRSDGVEWHKLGSTEFGAVGLEEATDVPRPIFKELQQRLRLPVAAQMDALQIWLTANPFASWVKEDFISNPRPGYQFIQALMSDNEHNYAGYEQDMRGILTDEEARAFIGGDWDALSHADQTIPEHLLQQALVRRETPDWNDVTWGMDVSRRGPDWTTLWQRAGLVFSPIDRWQGLRITETADRLRYHYDRAAHKPRRINVDVGGLGGGLADVLVRYVSEGWLGEVVIGEVNGAMAASDPIHYVNKNAELAGKLESILRIPRGQIVPDAERLVLGDLGFLRTSWQKGRRKVQSNDQIRAIHGRSPDDGDGLLYTLDDGDGRGQDYVPNQANPDAGDYPYAADLAELSDDEMQALLEQQRQSERRERTARNFFNAHGLEFGYPGTIEEDPWGDDQGLGYGDPRDRFRQGR